MGTIWVFARAPFIRSSTRRLPSDSYFQTSCSADGKIIVWDLTQQEPRQVKLIDGIIPTVKDKEYVAQTEL
jgi:hypothetical protein